jgi:hypothetical protein
MASKFVKDWNGHTKVASAYGVESPGKVSISRKSSDGSGAEETLLTLGPEITAAPVVGGNQYDGNFSPDGHWLAYFSDETGQPEVYVVPFPGPGGKYQISPRRRMDRSLGQEGRSLLFNHW